MTLLFVKETGHVLAAITRAADAEAQIEATALAGEALLVRFVGDPSGDGYDDTVLSVPADQLDVFTADYEARALVQPNDYFVAGTDDQKKAQQVNRTTQVDPASPILADNSQVEILVKPPVPDKTKVLMMLAGPTPNDWQLATGESILHTTPDKSRVTINVAQLKPDTEYSLLILVAGVWPHTKKIKSKP
ncbi:MAG TPA: hypothetical protein VGB05_03565 [Pyrinomonadaceae bacterium]